VEKNLQTAANNIPISDDRINKDMNRLIDTLSIYKTHLQHPMIVHHAKRAHAYKVCCGSIETPDMFNQYLANFDRDSKQTHYMDQFFTKWFVIISFHLKNK
jgi:hypothetical protein